MIAAWVDGVEARSVVLDDRGLHYGDGLFETIAASGGRARLLAAHLARLAHGCAALGIAMPDTARLRAEIARAAGLAAHVVVKLIVTRGSATGRGYAAAGNETPRRIVCAYAWPEGPEHAPEPARVAVAQRRVADRPLLAGVKHLNRLEQVLARTEARERGLDEALLCTDDGRIVSGGMTNLFLAAGERLVTPPAGQCAVAGVMRAATIDCARRFGLRVEERSIGLAELATAGSAWLTNARVGLWPVARLEDRALAEHPATRPLQAALRAAAEAPDA